MQYAYFWPELFKQFICHACLLLLFNNLSTLCFCSVIYDISEELDLSHFIGSDETAAPQHLVVFLGNNAQKWFFTDLDQDNNTQGTHEHNKFWRAFSAHWVLLWKALLSLIHIYSQELLKKVNFKALLKFPNFFEMFHCDMTRFMKNYSGYSQELLSKKKIWDELILRNFLNSAVSVKYFIVQ